MVWFLGPLQNKFKHIIWRSLTWKFGVGNFTAGLVWIITGLSKSFKLSIKHAYFVEVIGGILLKYFVLGTYLNPRLQKQIRRMGRASTVRSLCYDAGLPMRGQRARSNARIRKSRKVLSKVKWGVRGKYWC